MKKKFRCSDCGGAIDEICPTCWKCIKCCTCPDRVNGKINHGNRDRKLRCD